VSLATQGNVLRGVVDGPDPASLAPPSELLAAVVTESERPEWEFLKGGRICIGYVSEAAGAGARAVTGLRNPVDSGTLCVVEEVSALADVAINRLTVHLLTALLTAGMDSDGVEAQRDTRGMLFNTTAHPPACLVISDTVAVPGGVYGSLFPSAVGLAKNYFKSTIKYVLQPGSAVLFVNTADNNGLTTNFVWRERAIEPQELIGAARSQ
jgi:hypothetical protein